MEVDFIIVGCGLAGISFCELLVENKKSFVVYDNHSQQSSTVAGGMYNPVILKRFTPVWKSKELLKLALPLYNQIERRLNITIDHKIPVLRKFISIEEQNNWYTASDKYGLSEYLSTCLVSNTNIYINAPHGFGEVLQTGRIDTPLLTDEYKKWLLKDKRLFEEAFNYDEVKFEGKLIEYKSIQAKHIVFAEGFGLKQNPYFNYLPLNGTKGELITIYAPQLKLNEILKSNVFLIPLIDDKYLVGATYEWTDKTNTITEQAKIELEEKLKTVINCNYEIIDQVAGIRPTVKDRRPLVGKHPKRKNVHLLNGLGTRGVMIAPYVAKQLYQSIESDKPLDSEIDIKRFT